MKFELDCDYFNRAGDKVRYVGYNCVSDKAYVRRADTAIYLIRWQDGRVSDEGDAHQGDILDLWEITDAPDRVYVIKGSEFRRDSIAIKYGGLSEVEKILIKPFKNILSKDVTRSREVLFNGEFAAIPDKLCSEGGHHWLITLDDPQGHCTKCGEGFSWGKEFKSQPKKIEPIVVSKTEMKRYSRSERVAISKINELINAYNKRLDF